jgi:acyl carrier protein
MNPKLVQTISTILKVEPSRVAPELSQENTPQWDSLTHLRLILELEQNLGVRFRSQDIPAMTSVAAIEDVLRQM